MNKASGLWIGGVLVAATVAALRLPPPTGNSIPAKSAESVQAESRLSGPPDLRELAARLSDVAPPTPEQIAEQRRVESEQVAHALRLLQSAEPEERIGAIEQLSAYPTRDAEKALAAVLAGDKSAEVRSAAAQSLGYVKEPARETLQALLKAVQDPNEDVRGAALEALENYLSHTEKGTARFRQIVAGLKQLANSRKADRHTTEAIRELLVDR